MLLEIAADLHHTVALLTTFDLIPGTECLRFHVWHWIRIVKDLCLRSVRKAVSWIEPLCCVDARDVGLKICRTASALQRRPVNDDDTYLTIPLGSNLASLFEVVLEKNSPEKFKELGSFLKGMKQETGVDLKLFDFKACFAVSLCTGTVMMSTKGIKLSSQVSFSSSGGPLALSFCLLVDILLTLALSCPADCPSGVGERDDHRFWALAWRSNASRKR